jgi:site-specific DNA recombinase
LITAAKYRRISDDKESEEHGLTRQNEDIDKLAADEGITIVSDRSDNDIGASTRSKKARPDYNALIADAKAGRFQVIIAYTSSRLTRRLMELEQQIILAEQYGIKFRYVKSPSFDLNTADGRMVARMLAAADAAEAERIGERVSRARVEQAKAGTWGGGRRPFGYSLTDKPGVLEIDETEAAAMREMARRLLNGISLRSVAAEMNNAGIPTVSGQPWKSETLRYILTKDLAQKILGEETWLGIKALFVARKQGTGSEPSHLLSGLVNCVCSTPMQFHATRKIYRCKTSRAGCAVADAAFLESYVSAAVCAWLALPANVDLLRPPAPGTDTAQLRQDAAACRAELEGLAVELGQGMPRAEWRIASDGVRKRLAEYEAALAATVFASPALDLANAADIPSAWDVLSLATRRAIIAELLVVTVEPRNGRDADDAVSLVWRPE